MTKASDKATDAPKVTSTPDETPAVTGDQGDQAELATVATGGGTLSGDAAVAATGDPDAAGVEDTPPADKLHVTQTAEQTREQKIRAGVCVVTDSDTPHMGRAVNGLVCSAHAMHYDADGNRRGAIVVEGGHH